MMPQERFNERYNRGHREEPDHRRRVRPDFDRNRTPQRRGRSESAYSAPKAAAPSRVDNVHLKSGIAKFKDFDYEGAIAEFLESLKVNEQDAATHWNLACAYSLTENVERGFFHLDRCVALGFNDFLRIKQHDALAYLRIQEQFDTFERNNYRLLPNIQPESEEKDLLETKPDLLDQLKKLAELREHGILTEEEFAEKKRKLLG